MRRSRVLTVAAWVVFLIDAAGVSWLTFNGWLADDPLGRSIALGVATLFAIPLVVLLVVLALCSWRRSAVGLWICLALGFAPIILALINIARHSA